MHDWGFEQLFMLFLPEDKSPQSNLIFVNHTCDEFKIPIISRYKCNFKARYTRVKFTKYMKLVYILKEKGIPQKEQNDEAFSKVIASAEIAESRMVQLKNCRLICEVFM